MSEINETKGYKERLRNLNYQYIEEPQFYDDLEHALSLIDTLQKEVEYQKELTLEFNKMHTEISLRETDKNDLIDKLNNELEGYKKVYYPEWIKQRDDRDKFIKFLQKEKDMLKQTLITIGNLARKKDNITLQEINRHVDDALDSLE